jgi:hypothetical protein
MGASLTVGSSSVPRPRKKDVVAPSPDCNGRYAGAHTSIGIDSLQGHFDAQMKAKPMIPT